VVQSVTTTGCFVALSCVWEFRELQNSGNWCARRDNFPIDVDPIGKISYRCREDCVLFSALVQYIMGWRCHASGFRLLSGIPGIVDLNSESATNNKLSHHQMDFASVTTRCACAKRARDIDAEAIYLPNMQMGDDERDRFRNEMRSMLEGIAAAGVLFDGHATYSLTTILRQERASRCRIETREWAEAKEVDVHWKTCPMRFH